MSSFMKIKMRPSTAHTKGNCAEGRNCVCQVEVSVVFIDIGRECGGSAACCFGWHHQEL